MPSAQTGQPRGLPALMVANHDNDEPAEGWTRHRGREIFERLLRHILPGRAGLLDEGADARAEQLRGQDGPLRDGALRTPILEDEHGCARGHGEHDRGGQQADGQSFMDGTRAVIHVS